MPVTIIVLAGMAAIAYLAFCIWFSTWVTDRFRIDECWENLISVGMMFLPPAILYDVLNAVN